ncbi:MAG TPA: hypothetical protein VFY29_04680, partial [Terriglobia bacterium]|nr:hypothetical protein [Terriglobia bacterium]
MPATIATYGPESNADRRVQSICDFFGVTFEVRQLDRQTLTNQAPHCLMLGARTLSRLYKAGASEASRITETLRRVPYLFVYGITDEDEAIDGVRSLTAGLVTRSIQCERAGQSYAVHPGHRSITEEFTGLTCGPADTDPVFGLVTDSAGDNFVPLITVGGLPFFSLLKNEVSSLFLLCGDSMTDIHAPTDGVLSARRCFSGLIPVAMFLRNVFGNQIWHSSKRYASLVIDDPLLRRSYGFLSYARLLEEMDRSSFASTIAFIPWNYRRTQSSIAGLIRERSDRFGICVHGCDHTGGEFAGADPADLNWRARLAIDRMTKHQALTGIPCAPVMVFPQGKFSTVAMEALKRNNYEAALNSTAIPVDQPRSHGLTLADLMTPAVMKFSAFPLFMRRYPRSLADFALDLFLGKPAILVEHHDYFRNGYNT